MARFKNVGWDLPVNAKNDPETWEQVQVALLMDIRDELQAVRSVLQCHNTLQIPNLLRDIRKNTTKKRRTKAVQS